MGICALSFKNSSATLQLVCMYSQITIYYFYYKIDITVFLILLTDVIAQTTYFC